jgi:hypothetical protein
MLGLASPYNWSRFWFGAKAEADHFGYTDFPSFQLGAGRDGPEQPVVEWPGTGRVHGWWSAPDAPPVRARRPPKPERPHGRQCRRRRLDSGEKVHSVEKVLTPSSARSCLGQYPIDVVRIAVEDWRSHDARDLVGMLLLRALDDLWN